MITCSVLWVQGLSDMVMAYIVGCTRGSGGDMHMEWVIEGYRCSGRFLAQALRTAL